MGSNGSTAVLDKGPIDLDKGQEQLVRIPLKDLHAHPKNREEGDVADIVATLKTVGLLEPLLVRPRAAGGYEIACGHRRRKALEEAGHTEAPCVIREMDDKTTREVMVVENARRKDLTPLEEASAFKELSELGMSQREIASRIGCDQSHVSKRLSLLELPPPAWKALDSGGITVEEALELTKLRAYPKRCALALRRRDEWGGISQQVKNELKLQATEDKAAESLQKLKADGVKVIAWPSAGWWSRKEQALKDDPDYHRINHDPVQLTRKQHEGEPCHAATIDDRTGGIHYLCTKPDRHKTKGASSVKGGLSDSEKAARAKKRAHNKERREAQAARAEFITKLLARRVTKQDLVDLVVGAVLLEAAPNPHRTTALAGELLGLKPKKHQYGGDDFHAALRDQWGDDGKVALALGIAAIEQHLRLDYGSWKYPEIEYYFDFLERHGYEKSKAERLELSGRAP